MPQIVVYLTLFVALLLFVLDKIRYDLVSLLALFTVVIFGVIPPESAFIGFGHPAVITVAAVMIIGHGMLSSGIIDLVAKYLQKTGGGMVWQILSLSLITAIASAFMNNVGALAIMMPVAIKLAQKNGYSSSAILMPLAFSSLLGGMSTLIGTPPNIIISSYRATAIGSSFRIFDFAPIGIVLSLIGIVFMAVLGWRLIPKRKTNKDDEERFKIEDYIAELQVEDESKILAKTVADVQENEDYEVNILSIIRNKRRIHIPVKSEKFQGGDIIVIESDSENLDAFMDAYKLKLVGEEDTHASESAGDEVIIKEVVVLDRSRLIGKTAVKLHMRSIYGTNLLAIARGNRRLIKRMDHISFKAGDVLLLQGRKNRLQDSIERMGCYPVSGEDIKIGNPKRMISAILIFGASIISIILGLLDVQIAFALAALLMVLVGVIPFREVYDNINWPIIILLGAMIPVGLALESSGGADQIASFILSVSQNLAIWQVIAGLMAIAMLLSNIINNAATAVLMAPIAIKISSGMQLAPDSFLMAIALGASAAFLTPIGHQSNTLVMSPGGYKFSDYWRLGLPIQIMVLFVGTLMIQIIWL
jgi:di/tricarboxylate transporter